MEAGASPEAYRQNDGAAKPKRVDEFAAAKTKPDYKNYEQLRRYVNAQGKILPRRRSGLSAKNQRLVARRSNARAILRCCRSPGPPSLAKCDGRINHGKEKRQPHRHPIKSSESGHFYLTEKNRKNDTARLELKKV